jgi:hypothetical protein
MRAVIIGTDFVKDIDGSFKAIETNTNIGLDVNITSHIDANAFTSFILNNSIEQVHLIYTPSNIEVFEESEEITPDSRFNKFLSGSICLPNEITYVEHRLEKDSITIPQIDDADNKLIIRVSYDTTALMDDVYARDNWEFLKIMHENDANSVPKCYINDVDLGIDNIGEVLRDNGNHPNYCIKKRITPSDNKVYPKLYKIDTTEQLENLKSSLEVDEYIQEYIYNTEELIEDKLFHYRSVDLVYNQLDSLNLYVYNKTNIAPVVTNCDFNDNKEVEYWDRPRYVSKVLNGTNEISIRLDADATTKIVLNDNSIVTADNLNINDEVKSIHFNDVISTLKSDDWSSSYSGFSQNYNITSSTVIEKDTFEYYGPIINLELDNGSNFSDVPHGIIFKVVNTPVEDTIETNVVQIEYNNLSIGDTLIVLNNETNTIETKVVQNILYSFEKLDAYRINVEESDFFFSMEETENQPTYGILTHNYDYDCQYQECYAYGDVGGYRCSDGAQYESQCGLYTPACTRYGGPYGTGGYNCYYFGVYGCNFISAAYFNGSYCNGQKSDKRLKKNINFLYEQENGIKIYEFEFIDDAIKTNPDLEGKWRGVIAQDLIDTKFEDALTLEEDGYFAVNYEKISVELIKLN